MEKEIQEILLESTLKLNSAHSLILPRMIYTIATSEHFNVIHLKNKLQANKMSKLLPMVKNVNPQAVFTGRSSLTLVGVGFSS